MLLPLNAQISIVLFSFLSGLLVGILFDGYRLIRGFKVPKAILIIEDTLFWIITSIIIFIFLLILNYGFLGFYVYIFIGFGILTYLAIFSNKIVRVENKIAKVSFRTIRIFGKNIRYIFKNIFIK